jgi:penicillin-insensitive murein DD-endopeptidase
MRTLASSLATALLLTAASGAVAQDKGTLNPRSLPPLAHPDDPKTPAKQLFGRKFGPTAGPSHVVGFYSSGCLAGAEPLPINGPTWQVMRLSRNRNWGHPQLIHFLENLSAKAAKTGMWPGLLVGDMSQPRGGPMITGHASHQVGLDTDIWLSPMPPRELTRLEREEMSSTMVVADDRKDVDPKVWKPGHFAIIKAAAQDSLVQRVFVNAAIKKALCREAGTDRAWLEKVRPWWGHDYHFHVRLRCPGDSPEQAAAARKRRRRLRQGSQLLVHRRRATPQTVAGTGGAEAGQAPVEPPTGVPRGAGGARSAHCAAKPVSLMIGSSARSRRR